MHEFRFEPDHRLRQAILEQLDDLVVAGADGHGIVDGAAQPGAFAALFGRAAARIQRPLLKVELQHEITGAAFAKVRDGALDASFYYGEIEHPSVDGIRLRESTYRVAAPAAWADRVVDADWSEIALQPWVITPAISTHHKLVRALFDKHGIEPTKVVEADQESVIANLVESGVGLSLIREDLALEKEAAGEVCIWRDVRLDTTLWFIYLQARKDDPAIRALLSVLRDTWKFARVSTLHGHKASLHC